MYNYKSKKTTYQKRSAPDDGRIYQMIPRHDEPNQAAGWITRCASCGDWIIIRHRMKTNCVFCQAIKCGMDIKSFSRFYRSGQWRQLRQVVFEQKGRGCIYCLNPATHIDHIMPIARGGTNLLSNLQPVCGRCNIRKHRLTDAEFKKKSIVKWHKPF